MKAFVRILLALSMMGSAQAGVMQWLFGAPTPVQGTVGYVQANHFMLVSQDNQYLRIFLKEGQLMPSTIVPGMFVQASVYEDDRQFIILESLDAVQGPNGTVMPIMGPGGTPEQ